MTSGLELAARCDAEGRHEDAVAALAKAARGNDFTAMTSLAKRMVIGDRAPYMPEQGAKLMGDAARGGNADAALRLACMMALGAHVPQNWNTALQLLVHAATLGSDSARGQLQLLAGFSPGEGGEDWIALARGIDLNAWMQPVPGTVLLDGPRIAHFSNFISPAVCHWLRQEMAPHLKPAKIYSADHHGHVEDAMRTNSIGPMHVCNIDFVNVLVQYRISAVTQLPVTNFDGPTALHYDVGQEIKDHFDYINPDLPNYADEMARGGERLITFLLYLNDDYDGGETAFPIVNVSHKGALGDGLMFVNVLPDRKPDTRSVHAGRPPTRGEKWLLSQFIRQNAVHNTPAESLY